MIDASKTLGVAILIVVINIVLMTVKIVVGIVGNSYALVADGIESAADIFSSIIAWAGFQYSLRPADENHPYGHGKVESLAGLFSGGALIAAAGVIAWHSIAEIRAPHHVPEWFTLPVLIGVVVVKIFLSKMITKVSENIDSRALEGDAWHHISDAITSGAAAIGIVIALIGGEAYAAADDWAALIACCVIVTNGFLISKRSLHEVLDGQVDAEISDTFRRDAAEVEGVVNIEKCRVRKSGVNLFMELHVWVDGSMTVSKGHQIGHAVKDHLKQKHPTLMDVHVHIEPATQQERNEGEL